MKYKVKGYVVHDKAGIRLQFSHDLARLWNWFILKETGMIMQTPLRCSKIGLHRYNSYHKAEPKKNLVKEVEGSFMFVEFNLNNIFIKYSRKGYWVAFINVLDPVLWLLIETLGLQDNFAPQKSVDISNQSNYSLPHMSIANGKYFKEKSS